MEAIINTQIIQIGRVNSLNDPLKQSMNWGGREERRRACGCSVVLRLSAATTSGGGSCGPAAPAVDTHLGLSRRTSSLHQLT